MAQRRRYPKARSSLPNRKWRRASHWFPLGITDGLERISTQLLYHHQNYCGFGQRKAPRSQPSTSSASTGPSVGNTSSRSFVQSSTSVQPLRSYQHGLAKQPVHYWDVFVDDAIGCAQGSKWKRRRTKQVLLHALDAVLRGLHPEDNPHRQEPASVKKMKKGDAT